MLQTTSGGCNTCQYYKFGSLAGGICTKHGKCHLTIRIVWVTK